MRLYELCHCFTCERDYHPLGIMGHRAKHFRAGEECKIRYTNGDIVRYKCREVQS